MLSDGCHVAKTFTPKLLACGLSLKPVSIMRIIFRWWGPESPGSTSGLRMHSQRRTEEETSMSKIRKFFKSDLGATAIEYGLIAALISVVIIAALQLTGNSLKTVFN